MQDEAEPPLPGLCATEPGKSIERVISATLIETGRITRFLAGELGANSHHREHLHVLGPNQRRLANGDCDRYGRYLQQCSPFTNTVPLEIADRST